MQLKKFKITTPKVSGYLIVTYQDNNFKSVLNEFKPALTEVQLNGILNYIPNDPDCLVAIFMAKYNDRIIVEPVKGIGVEPEQDGSPEFPANQKIALWCKLYELSEGVKYKTGAAEAGKLKAIPVKPDELERLIDVYLKSKEWYLTPKSISNFVKKYNEIRAMAYAKPKEVTFPLPYDEMHFNKLDLMGKRAYHDYLRANGYEFNHNPVRGGNWILKQTINQ